MGFKKGLALLAFLGISTLTFGQTSALDFNGTNQFAGSASVVPGASTNFTIEFYVNPRSTTTLHAESTSGAIGVGDAPEYALYPAQGGSNGGVGVAVGTNGIVVYGHGDGFLPALATTAVSINGWNHVAIVVENNTPKIYLNAGLVHTGVQSPRTLVPSALLGGGAYGYYDGQLDELRIWNYALTQPYLEANYFRTSLNPLETGLVTSYSLNEGSGTTIDDVSILNLDGTTNASWISLANGINENGLDFDGVDDFVSIPNDAAQNIGASSEGTYEIWMKTTDAGSSFRGLIVRQLGAGMFLEDNELIAFDWNGTSFKTGVHLNDGNWHHVALAFKMGEANGSHLYIDGELVKSFTYSVNNGTSATVIGAGDPAGAAQHFAGQLDEPRIWNVRRTQAEIQATINQDLTGNESGLLAAYQFQAISGSLAYDETPSNRWGVLNNMDNSDWVATSPYGVISSADLDGSSERFQGTSPELTATHTVEAWIYSRDNNGVRSIFRKGGDYDVYINGGRLYAEVWEEGSTSRRIVTGPTISEALNAWAHIAFTWNSGVGTFYINGLATVGSTSGFATIAISSELGIGGSSLYGQHFNGLIDDVRLWNEVRSQADIVNNMGEAFLSGTSNLIGYYKMDGNEGSSLVDYSGNGNNLSGVGIDASDWGAPVTIPTDNVAPVFEASSPSITSNTGFSFDVNIDLNEPSTVYYVVVPDGESAPSSAQIKAGQKSNGSAAVSSGSQSLTTGSLTHTFTASSIFDNTAYDIYVVAEDDESTPNIQTTPVKLDVTTPDINTSVSLDGSTEYFTGTNNNLPSGNSPFTIEAWIYPDQMGNLTIGRWGGSTTGRANAFRLSSNGLLHYWWGNDFAVTTGNISGAWHHVAVTWDGTTRSIYLDGILLGSQTPTAPNVALGNFYVGAVAPGVEPFDGKLDEYHIWNVARTQSQIQATMGIGGNPNVSISSPNLVAYYKMDGEASTLVDFSGNGNDLSGGGIDVSNWVSPTPFVPGPEYIAPKFENSTPSINTITELTFNLLVDVNEPSTIYYVVIPDGESAPSSSQVKAGQKNDGTSAFKSGSEIVISNSYSNTFAVSGVIPGTAYDVYVVAEDDESTPNIQSSPTKIDVQTLPDPAPKFENGTPFASNVTTNSFEFTVDLDQQGTVYYIAQQTGQQDPSIQQIKAGQYFNGSANPFSGSFTGASGNTFSISGFTEANEYEVLMVTEDDEPSPNLSLLPTILTVTTRDNNAPIFYDGGGIEPSPLYIDNTGSSTVTIRGGVTGFAGGNRTATIYAVAVPDGSPVPSAQQIKEGKDAFGVINPSNSTVTSLYVNTYQGFFFQVSGLTQLTNYDIFLTIEDNVDFALASIPWKLEASTIDDIPPLFENSTPSVSNLTPTTLDLDVDVNEQSTIYYVLGPSNTSTPSSDRVINGLLYDDSNPISSGSFQANTGDFTVSFPISGLTEGVSYKAYVVAQDPSGNKTSATEVNITMADVTVPTFVNSTPSLSSYNHNSAVLNADISEAGTIYYVAVPNGVTAPTSTQVKNGQNASGSAALSSGSKAVTFPNADPTLTVTGLQELTDYDIYVVAEDDNPSFLLQSAPVKLDVSTGSTPLVVSSISKNYAAPGDTIDIELASNIAYDITDYALNWGPLQFTVHSQLNSNTLRFILPENTTPQNALGSIRIQLLRSGNPETTIGNGVLRSASRLDRAKTAFFSGSNKWQRIETINALPISSGSEGTFEAWIKTNGGSNYRAIIVKEFAAGLFLLNGELIAYNYSTGQNISTGIFPNDNNWHHVALTFKFGETDGSHIYYDGNLVHSFTLNFSNTNSRISIGAGSYNGSYHFFQGNIDEVRIWDERRSASEILSNKNIQIDDPQTGLIANYHYDNIGPIYDYSGNGHDLTNVGPFNVGPVSPGYSPPPSRPVSISKQQVQTGEEIELFYEYDPIYSSNDYEVELEAYSNNSITTLNPGIGSTTNKLKLTIPSISSGNYKVSLVNTSLASKESLADVVTVLEGGGSLSQLAELTSLNDGTTEWGDIDQDGDLDILFVGSSVGQVKINDGLNSFASTTALPTYFNGKSAFGDFTGDGYLDVALVGQNGSPVNAKLYSNNGNGTFSEYQDLGKSYNAGHVSFADYDNDGDLDLLATASSGTDLYKNNSGSFSIDASINISNSGRDGMAVWNDFDDDDDLDFFIVGANQSRLYVNNTSVGGSASFSLHPSTFEGVNNASADWADYDGDGDSDILITGYSSTSGSPVTKLYQNNAGSFSVATSSSQLPGIKEGFSKFGDYDSDGDPDLVLLGMGDGDVRIGKVFENVNGNWHLQSSVIDSLDRSSADWGDQDGDGDLDLVISGLQATVGKSLISKSYVYQNQSDVAAPLFLSNSAESILTDQFTLNAAINEPGIVYYVILPDGSNEPSASQVKAGEDANGQVVTISGSAFVNAPDNSISSVVSGLDSGKNYDIYLVAEDNSGSPNLQSVVEKLDILTLDATPPIFEDATPSISAITPTSFDLTADIDEPGTIYFVIVNDGDSAPDSAQVIAGNNALNSAAIQSGSQQITSGNFAHTFSITGLTESTAYDVYVVAQDDNAVPNIQSAPTKLDVQTLDNTPPAFEFPTPRFVFDTDTTFKISLDLDSAGTVYYVVTPWLVTAPTPNQVRNGLNADGLAPIKSGSFDLTTGAFKDTLTVGGLDPDTEFTFYAIAASAANDQAISETVKSTFAKTKDNTPTIVSNLILNISEYDPYSPPYDEFNVSLSANGDDEGTMYFALVPENDPAPSDNQLIQGKRSNGQPAHLAGSEIFSYNYIDAYELYYYSQESISLLTGRTYDLYYFTLDNFARGPVTKAGTYTFEDYVEPQVSFSAARNTSSIRYRLSMDEPGTLYYSFDLDSKMNIYSPYAVENGENGDGDPAFASGSITFNAVTDTVDLLLEGLLENESYKLAMVTTDGQNSTASVNGFIRELPGRAATSGFAPVFETNTPSVANITEQTVELLLDINEAGTIYYSVVPSGATTPSIWQVVNGQTAAGDAAVASGSKTVSAGNFSHTFLVDGLSPGASYDIYTVAVNLLGLDGLSYPIIQDSSSIVSISMLGEISPPVFENSTPLISQITSTGFDLTADIDEAGTIFYVVLPDGAASPDSAQVIAGTDAADAAAIASGSQMVTSGDYDHTFTITGLNDQTAYDVYVVAQDNESFISIQGNPQQLDVTTLDGTAPVFENPQPRLTSRTLSRVELYANIDEVGTVFYVMLETGSSAPTSAQVIAGTDANGVDAPLKGSQFIDSGNFEHTFVIEGFTSSTAYTIYVVAQDDEGTPNVQASPTVVQMPVAIPPVLTSFTLYTNFEQYPSSDFDNYVRGSARSDTDGNVYFVLVPTGDPAPNYVQIIGGKRYDDSNAKFSDSIILFDNYFDGYEGDGNDPYISMSNRSFPDGKTYDVYYVTSKSGVWSDVIFNQSITLDDYAEPKLQYTEIRRYKTSNSVRYDFVLDEPGTFSYIFDKGSNIGYASINDIENGQYYSYVTGQDEDALTSGQLTFTSAFETQSVTVDGLESSTWYEYYFFTDDGSNRSEYEEYVSVQTATVGTAVQFENATPSIQNVTESSFELTVDLNEAGSVFYVVVPRDNGDPSSWQVFDGFDFAGQDAITSDSTELAADESFTFTVDGLSSASDYDVYVVAHNETNQALTLQDTPTKIQATTVDLNAPEFENATPIISEVTTAGFDLQVDINEGGTIYYVVVGDNDASPSTSQIIAGNSSNDTEALASGSAAVSTADFDTSFVITGLSEFTAYDVYIVAQDGAATPNIQESATKVDLTTLDGTSPAFENSTPLISNYTTTGFDLEVDINEAGSVYYVIVNSGELAPSLSQLKQGKNSVGSAAVKADSSLLISVDFSNTFTIADLNLRSDYDIYVVAEDTAATPNIQNEPTKISIAAIIEFPTVSLQEISAIDLSIGETISFNYSLSAAFDLPGQSINVQWYSADDALGLNILPIAGATDTTYSIKAGDLGKFLSARIHLIDGVVSSDTLETLPLGPVNPVFTLDERVAKFDGDGDYINFGSDINLANSSFTIEFWAKRDTTTSDGYIISQGTSQANYQSFFAGFAVNTSTFQFGFFGDILNANPHPIDTEWHHWAITYDNSTLERKIYRDGVLNTTDNAGGSFTGSGDLIFGGWNGNDFEGLLDELRIWDDVRTEDELRNTKFKKLKGDEPNLIGYWKFNEGLYTDTAIDLASSGIDGTIHGNANFSVESIKPIGTYLKGNVGWRILTAPIEGLTYGTFLRDVWTQGYPGATTSTGNANVFWYNEVTRQWVPPSDSSDIVGSSSSEGSSKGKAILYYAYEQDGWPKRLSTIGTYKVENLNLSLTETINPEDEAQGWHIIGNPYPFSIDWVDLVARSGLNNVIPVIFVYDPTANSSLGGYRINYGYDIPNLPTSVAHNGIIEPFQGFWVRTTGNAQDGSISFSDQDISSDDGTIYVKQNAKVKDDSYLLISVTGNKANESTLMRFDSQKIINAERPANLNVPPVELGLVSESGAQMAVRTETDFKQDIMEYELYFNASDSGNFQIKVQGMEDWDKDVLIKITDRETGEDHHIYPGEEITFDHLVAIQAKEKVKSPQSILLGNQVSSTSNSRFRLTIFQGQAVARELESLLPEQLELSQNYPNPFNPSTTINFALPELSEVSLQVFDVQGRLVSTLVEGQLQAGYHSKIFEASRLATGIYFYRLVVGSDVIVKKLTLIK